MTLSGRRRVVLSRLFYSGRARLRVRVLILLEIPRSVQPSAGGVVIKLSIRLMNIIDGP